MSNIDISTTAAAAKTSWTNAARQQLVVRLGVSALVLGLLGSSVTTVGVAAEGNIGCLFAETLCIEHLEWCYDDFAFGKCLPQYGLEPEELFREPLDEDASRFLAIMLEDLQGDVWAGVGLRTGVSKLFQESPEVGSVSEVGQPNVLKLSLTVVDDRGNDR